MAQGDAGLTDDDIIDSILRREGGFVDRASDRGGPTNMGITVGTLALFRDHPVTPSDIRTLSEVEARLIYQRDFIVRPGFERIFNMALRALAVDMAVNHGPGKAIRLLQRSVGVKEDGVIGDETIAAVNAAGTSATAKLCAERVKFYGAIIAADPSQSVFAAGWLNRAAEFISALGGATT